MPALPLHQAGPYVFAAYITFLVLILLYVAIMAHKLTKTRREVRDLHEIVELNNKLTITELEKLGNSDDPVDVGEGT